MFIDIKKFNPKKLQAAITKIEDTSSGWFRYYNSYIHVINIILEKSSQVSEIVAIPTLFLIRHAFELLLKSTIVSLNTILNKKIKFKSHTLDSLSKILISLLDECGNLSKLDKSTLKQLNELRYYLNKYTKDFHVLDETSQVFRYSTSKKNIPFLNEDVTHIDIYKYLVGLAELSKLRFSDCVFIEGNYQCKDDQ